MGAAVVLPATTTMACEKHLYGHQGGAQGTAEISR